MQSQIYVRIGLEEQSQGTRNKARKQSRQNAEDMCGRKTRMGCPVTLILIMVQACLDQKGVLLESQNCI